MESFIIFTESTNQDFVVITMGLLLIALSTIMKSFLGNVVSSSVNVIGIMLISYALLKISTQIKKFYDVNPSFLTDYRYEPYRQNIYAGIFLCIIILLLICYSTYTIIF
jgi:hypothetical protein